MKNSYNKLILLLFAITIVGCSTEDDLVKDWIEVNEPKAVESGKPGSLDLSKFVSVGNSLTAGFADGALYTESQNNSFPKLLSEQFKLVGGGAFNQPDINSENGYHSALSKGDKVLGRTILDLSDRRPVPTAGELPTPFAGDKSALNNFGVPGVITGQLLTPLTGRPGNSAFNGLYGRFASNPGVSTIIGDVVAANPTFFSLWIGSNDILGYAASGGAGRSITSAPEFKVQYQMVVDSLKADPGVVLSIPPVLLTPFFRAVTWNNVELDAATAEKLNTSLESVNDAIKGTAKVGYTGDISKRLISYKEGKNPILVYDEDLDNLTSFFNTLLTVKVNSDDATKNLPEDKKDSIKNAKVKQLAPYAQSRPMTEDELVLLTAGAVLGTEADTDESTITTIGVVIPLGFSLKKPEESSSDQYFLTKDEQNAINKAVVDLNKEIGTIIATENGKGADIAFIDVTPTFYDLFGVAEGDDLGIKVDGAVLMPDFAPSGVFSSDAIHPNARGNGIIANKIIDTMNERWGASIPKVSVLTLKGTPFQQ